jgi:hypothetical protein
LLAADGPYGLLIYDVTNAAAPIFLSQFTANNPVWDVAIVGTTALVASDASGLVALDISNPLLVRQLSQTILPIVNPFPPPMSGSNVNPAVSISIQNGLAYVGTSFGFIFGFDIDHPANPRLVALNLIGGTIHAINALGNNLFIAADGVEMQLDNALPYNSIQLFYPPPAFSHPAPFTDWASSANTIRNNKGKASWIRREGVKRSQNRTPIPSISDCLARTRNTFSRDETFWQKLTASNACRHAASQSRGGTANPFGLMGW